jgi:hypothetical protein
MAQVAASRPELSTLSSAARAICGALREGGPAHAIHLAIAAIYLSAFVAIAPGWSIGFFVGLIINMFTVLAIAVAAALLSAAMFHFFHMLTVTRPERPLKDLRRQLAGYCRDRQRLASGLPVLFALVLFMTAYSGIKPLIPYFAGGFPWDATFTAWDRSLHGDRLPWEWMQPVLGHPPVTFVINVVYNGWFFVCWMALTAFAFTDRPGIDRTRYFLTFMIVWSVGGALLATAFSSAGPAFYTRIGLTPDPYAPLMAYLRDANEILPIWALSVQDKLWQGFGGITPFEGISAMPSMHNGTALLIALAGARFGKTMHRLLWLHCALIFIGSVHLGWHYAVDAYLAWALTLAAWWASAPVARWWHARLEVRHFAMAPGTVS